MNSKVSVRIMREGNCEWLQEALQSGILTGEIKKRVRRLTEENIRLRDENDVLRKQLNSKRGTISALREMYISQMNGNDSSPEDRKMTMIVLAGCAAMVLTAVASIIMVL